MLPFEVASLDLRGRLTRLGPALDEVLAKHDYPAPVGKLLGEALSARTVIAGCGILLGVGIVATRRGEA